MDSFSKTWQFGTNVCSCFANNYMQHGLVSLQKQSLVKGGNKKERHEGLLPIRFKPGSQGAHYYMICILNGDYECESGLKC